MHKKGALLLLIFLLIVIIVSLLWEDEKPDVTPIPIENTTEFITQEETDTQVESRFTLEETEDQTPVEPPEESTKEMVAVEEKNIAVPESTTDTFTLINSENERNQITISNQKIVLQHNEKPIIMLNLFATWCPPCTGQIAYLNDLQKKHQKELAIVGILTHDDIDKASLETFMAKQQVNYFISQAKDNDSFTERLANELHLDEDFSIPLSVIYVDGEYFTHYEGSVPVEMIEYDIQQAKKQLNSR